MDCWGEQVRAARKAMRKHPCRWSLHGKAAVGALAARLQAISGNSFVPCRVSVLQDISAMLKDAQAMLIEGASRLNLQVGKGGSGHEKGWEWAREWFVQGEGKP